VTGLSTSQVVRHGIGTPVIPDPLIEGVVPLDHGKVDGIGFDVERVRLEIE
jgi:hypothetical protein